jgi:SAM-dependent methyltransferase
VYYDGSTFPLGDVNYDAVLCNQVLEHVFNPHKFLSELARVLKPGGRLLLTVPFVSDEHEQPFDWARYTTFGLRAMLERQGFRVLKQERLLANASILFQLTNAYLYKVIGRRNVFISLFCRLAFFAPITVMGLIAAKLLPRNPDLFLDQLVIVQKPFVTLVGDNHSGAGSHNPILVGALE